MSGTRKRLQDFVTETRVLPGLDAGPMFKSTVFQNALARFSQLEYFGRPEATRIEGLALPWQGLLELDLDHGFSVSYGVFFDTPTGTVLNRKPTADIIAEIQAELGAENWGRIDRHLATLGDETDKEGHRRIFLVAAWAELFTEPFCEVWLAAMAQHAYYVLQNDYAFGYLTALLGQKQQNETHFLRGKKSVVSASAGGHARAEKSRSNTQAVLRAMERYIAAGKSVARAAELAQRNGHGTSAEANRKLWHRHRKK